MKLKTIEADEVLTGRPSYKTLYLLEVKKSANLEVQLKDCNAKRLELENEVKMLKERLVEINRMSAM